MKTGQVPSTPNFIKHLKVSFAAVCRGRFDNSFIISGRPIFRKLWLWKTRRPVIIE